MSKRTQLDSVFVGLFMRQCRGGASPRWTAGGGCRYVIFLLLGGFLFAQSSLPAIKPSSITGTVIKEPGSEPLKKVLIQIIAENQKEGGNYTASTDTDGRFHVENMQPGRYRLFLERTGFVGVNERGVQADTNIFTVQAGQSVDDLLFHMLATAVISGRITDEDGDPLSGVSVMAQKKRPGRGGRENAASGTTNDLGEYRLFGLFPGQYWIVAIPQPDFRDYEQPRKKDQVVDASGSDVSANTDDTQADTRYLTTYYPGTFDSMQATAVVVKAADELPVNFTLTPARTYRIRGLVTGLAPGQKPSVELFSKAGDAYRANATEIGADGQFEVRGVGPGSYTLRASAGTESQPSTAHQDISVVAGDVEGVKLVPQHSFTIAGNLSIVGSGDVTHYSPILREAEMSEDAGLYLSRDLSGMNAIVDRSGNFAWKNVDPGTYIVQMFGGESKPFFLKSVTLGGQDVLTGFTATGPVQVYLQLSTRGGVIEGSVVEKEKDVDDEHPVANAEVVAVPEEKYRNLPDRFLFGETDQHGHFTIRGIPPGGYKLYSWQDVEDTVWHDPNFLKAQEANGVSVKVEEGSDQKVDLKPSPVGEDWR
jgi:Carboxypeptidase regulatory-like domain